MLTQVFGVYVCIALFTALSIVMEWTFTGSKTDYWNIRFKLRVANETNPGWYTFTYVLVVLIGSVMWPYVYWYRTKDVIRAVRSK